MKSKFKNFCDRVNRFFIRLSRAWKVVHYKKYVLLTLEDKKLIAETNNVSNDELKHYSSVILGSIKIAEEMDANVKDANSILNPDKE